MEPLALTWYILAALLFGAFVLADGFDLGAGILYGFERNADRRERMLRAIAPVWGGSEIWLLAGMAALLVAFPSVYSTFLGSMAPLIIAVLAALLFRALGIELRIRIASRRLGGVLDALIVVGSIVPALAVGLVGANLLQGLPVDSRGVMQGGVRVLFGSFSILGALASGTAFALHGALFLGMRTSGEFRAEIEGWSMTLLAVLAVLLVAGGVWSRSVLRARYVTSLAMPLFWGVMVLGLGAYASVWVDIRFERRTAAFVGSCVGISSIAVCSASLLFPMMIPSTLDPAASLTVGNAASDAKSLRGLLLGALGAIPLILVYVFVSYRSMGRRRRPPKS